MLDRHLDAVNVAHIDGSTFFLGRCPPGALRQVRFQPPGIFTSSYPRMLWAKFVRFQYVFPSSLL